METLSVGRPVPRAGWVLAVAAALCAAPVLVLGVLWVKTLVGLPLILLSLAAAAPLLSQDCTDFRPACLVFGWGLLAVSVLGAVLGLFVLAPSGIVLLTAASRARPEPRRLPLLIGALVATATLGFIGWAVGTVWIAP
nr:hypothetical protein KPHV_83170 [Kitasatospora purpeofusca]